MGDTIYPGTATPADVASGKKFSAGTYYNVAGTATLAGAPTAGSQTFNSSATFTVPANTYRLHIEAWGAGQAGTSLNGNGGSSGDFVSGFLTVTPGQQLFVSVGAGGGPNYGAGGDTTVGSITAKGAGSANASSGGDTHRPGVSANTVAGAGAPSTGGDGQATGGTFSGGSSGATGGPGGLAWNGGQPGGRGGDGYNDNTNLPQGGGQPGGGGGSSINIGAGMGGGGLVIIKW